MICDQRVVAGSSRSGRGAAARAPRSASSCRRRSSSTCTRRHLGERVRRRRARSGSSGKLATRGQRHEGRDLRADPAWARGPVRRRRGAGRAGRKPRRGIASTGPGHSAGPFSLDALGRQVYTSASSVPCFLRNSTTSGAPAVVRAATFRVRLMTLTVRVPAEAFASTSTSQPPGKA